MINNLFIRRLAAFWGVAGVVLLLGFAVYRLYPFAIDLLSEQLGWWHYLIIVVWSFVMVYSEGVQAFGKQFSPRVVARAQTLTSHATWPRLILAPLFCIGYFAAPKKRVITAYALVSGIVILIVIVHFIAQPWRGIIDIGVVLGLICGICTLLYYSWQSLRGVAPKIDAEVVQ